jgi:oligopeptidase B
MRTRSVLPFFALLLGCAAAAVPALSPAPAPAPDTSAASAAAPVPPVAERRPHAVQIHGRELPDDYHWLREKGTPAVQAYLRAENAYTEAMMAGTKGLQETLYREMLARLKETDLSVLVLDNGYWYYARTQAGQQYPITCRKRGTLEAPEEILLDPNAIAAAGQLGFVGVGALEVSDDTNLLGFSVDTQGFRQYTLQFRDLRGKTEFPERIPRVTSVAWAADSQTVLYALEDEVSKRSYRVHRHRLGTDPASDPVVYEETDERFSVGVSRTRSREYLLIGSSSHTTSEVRFVAAKLPSAVPVLIEPRLQGHEYDVDHRDDRFFIRTNSPAVKGGPTAQNFRLVTAKVSQPGRARWKEVVPHREDVCSCPVKSDTSCGFEGGGIAGVRAS